MVSTTDPKETLVEDSILKELGQLNAVDEQEQARCLLTVTLLLQQLPELQLPESIVQFVPTITACLTKQDLTVKRNATALLAGLASANKEFQVALCEQETIEVLLEAVRSSSDDAGVSTNVASILAAMAQGGLQGAQLVSNGPGAPFLISQTTGSMSSSVRGAAADALCAICTHAECRTALVQQGVLAAFASVLGDLDVEARLRGLMGLAMILPGNDVLQVDFSMLPGAVAKIMTQVKQDQDVDCKAIAGSVFALLAANPLARSQIAAELRGSQTTQS